MSRRSPITLTLAAALAVSASVIAGPPAGASPGDYPQTQAAAQAAIERSLAETGATSVTGGLTDLNDLIWQGSAGIIDAGGAASGPDTIYGIGSTSKMFAAVAVMQLVDQGLVDLDLPVVRYLPNFSMRSPQYRQVTVRMLLDHSAGFPGGAYRNLATTRPYPGYAQGVVANLAQSSLKTTPGAMSVYCNDCFTLAGELVAAVSGMSFTTYVDQEILAPLGMTRSGYITTVLPPAGTVARWVAGGETLPFEVFNGYAAGGLLSTSSDMAAFARMFLAEGAAGSSAVLTGSSVAEMGRSQMRTTLDPVTDARFDYGLGWDNVDNITLKAVGVRAWVKGGDTGQYHSSLIVAPEAGLAAFVAGAGDYESSAAQAVAEEIILNALVERGDLPAMPDKIGTSQPSQATPTDADFASVLGIYIGTSIYRRLARVDDSQIRIDYLIDGRWVDADVTLSYRTDGAWWIDEPSAQSFTTVKGWGRTYLVSTKPQGYGSSLGRDILGQRVTPGTAIAKEWRARLGQWLLVSDAPTSFRWLVAPGTRITRIPGLPGYIDVQGASAADARKPGYASMFLQVPLLNGRDLDDLVPVNARTLRMGSNVMISRDRLATLRPGVTSVRIGSQGYGEWREVSRATQIDVRGADAWYVYDANLEGLAYGYRTAKGVPVPAGGLVLVLADAGDRVKVGSNR